MSSRLFSDAGTERLDDAEIMELARRFAHLRLSDPPHAARSDIAHSNVSCYSFLRSLISPRRSRNSGSQSDPGVVPPSLNASHRSGLRASEVSPAPPSVPITTVLDGDTPVVPGGVPSQVQSLGFSALELERFHDSAQKRANNAVLPVGGKYKGYADTRTIEAFLQQVHRCPSWNVGSVPSFFRSFYSERCLDESVRDVVVDIVDRKLQDDGKVGYDRLMARAQMMEKNLCSRFDSIHAQGILVEQWQSLKWSPGETDFETFYLRFQQVAEAYSRQRGEALRESDLSSRLFSALPSDLKERVIWLCGPCPSYEELLNFGRRMNLVYVRRKEEKVNGVRGPLRKAAVNVVNDVSEALPVMPIEEGVDATTTTTGVHRWLLCRRLMHYYSI